MRADVECSFCLSLGRVELAPDRVIAEQLVAASCSICHRRGPLRLLAVVNEAEVASVHGPPDDIGDELLLERRIRERRT